MQILLTKASVESMASVLPFPKSTVFHNLLHLTFSLLIQRRLLKLTEDQINVMTPLLHNTANPTMIGGVDQHNQIPTSAWLNVDARILPESKVDDIVDEIKQVIGPTNFLPHQGPNGEELPPELTLEVMAYRKSCFQDPCADNCPAVLQTIGEIVKKRTDGVPIVTTIVPGITDN